jgi:hypothetical protein
MPAKHITLFSGITAFCIAVVVFSYVYGPTQRSFASPPRVLSVESTEQIVRAWEASAVKGRIAICFTRYLNALETKESKEVKATELSMHHGIIRRVFHITPDSAWPQIQATLSKRDDMRPTPEGFIGVFDDGRVYIMPFSRFSPIKEKALIIVEPSVWSRDELLQIANQLKSARISSDLAVIIRGSESDAELFRQAMAP